MFLCFCGKNKETKKMLNSKHGIQLFFYDVKKFTGQFPLPKGKLK